MAARQYWQLLYGMLLNKKSNMPSAGRPLKAIFAYFLGPVENVQKVRRQPGRNPAVLILKLVLEVMLVECDQLRSVR